MEQTKHRETWINRVMPDGTIERSEMYYNTLSSFENLISCYMRVTNQMSNLLNKPYRDKAAQHIEWSGSHIFFEHNNIVYITKIQQN